MMKKKRIKHNKEALLGKTKINAIDVLISKALIDLCTNHIIFMSVNNVLQKYNEISEKFKNLESSAPHNV